MKLDCQDYQEQIGPALMGDLDPSRAEALESHLANCPHCSRERQLMELTLEHLGSLAPVAAPRPFFLSPPRDPWRLVRDLSPAWRVALAATTLGLLLVGVLSLAGLQVQVADGVFSASFGSLPALPRHSTQEEQLHDDFVRTVLEEVDRRLSRRDRALGEALRLELTDLRREMDERQRVALSVALDELDQGLERRWIDHTGWVEAGVRDFVGLAYDQFQEHYLEDLTRVSHELDQVAARDALHERRMDLLSQAVLEFAAVPTLQGGDK